MAVVISEGMDDWTEHVIQTTSNLIKKRPEFNEDLESEFKSVTNFARGLSHNVLGEDRLETNPEYYFMYDIPRWLSPKNTKKLNELKLDSKIKVSFALDDEQYKIVQDNIDVYGDSHIGRSKTLKMTPNQKLWRKPLASLKHTTYLWWGDSPDTV